MPAPRHALAALALLLAACAGRTRPEGPPGAGGPPPGPPLPRSSVAAVLARAEKLGLDAAQVDALLAVDAELQEALAKLGVPRPPPDEERPRGIAESGGGPGGGGMGGGPGGGMGGGPGGGMGGGPPGGGMGGPPGGGGAARSRRPDPEAMAALEARMDEEDTRAFLRAEAILRPEQREAAREIASDYRAERFERRQARRR